MSFSVLYEHYDEINGSAYLPYADYLAKCFLSADIEVKEVLDLGCGTGGICAILADRGYDMVGIDISVEMLMEARERNAGKNTLLLCQDMRDFELYGTVQAVYSSFDSLNYITSERDLEKVFLLVKNYLEKGGVFAFDVNTEYRYTQIYDGKSYVYEFGEDVVIWRSSFDAEKSLCEFEIDSFVHIPDEDIYERYGESQLQMLHTPERIRSIAEKCGFSLVSVSGGKGFDGCTEEEKEYYLFKRM